MTQEINLVAIAEIKEGTWNHIADAVNECVVQSRKEEGNRYYTAYFQEDKPNRIVFIECWANQDALDKHGQTKHFQNLMQTVKPYALKPLELLKLISVTEKN